MVNIFLICIILLPLIGSIINGIGRNFVSKKYINIIASGVILIPFLISLVLFFKSKEIEHITYHYFNIIQVTNLSISFNLKLDHLSLLYINIITGIGFLIHIFSISYMKNELKNRYAVYFSYLNLFIFFMLLLVLGGNYFILFFGWEGVGLCSYFLIGYWFTNPQYIKAAKKAFIMNRIGDAAFLLAIFWIILKLHRVDFDFVLTSQSISLLSKYDITAITILFFIGATGKSAQIPLFTWLPDAMAGPTPVSALIHAATMVTAGIYLIVRSNILFQLAPFTNHIILIIGTCTMLLAASIALKQKDIKKILAYSTVSQLGYMFIALGLGAYSTAVFHVITHAFFKALLFLGAGSIIFSLHHEQNIFNMGGLKKLLPITHITFLIGCLAIAGIPPFSGFFSKDQILMAMFNHSPIFYTIGLIGALMTAFYMFRLYFLVFYGEYKNHHIEIQQVKEQSIPIKFTLIVLAIGSIFAGILGLPEVLGGNDFLHNYLSPIVKYSTEIHISHNTEIILMLISCVAVLMVIFIARSKYIKNQTEQKMNGIALFLYNKWYIDELYDFAIVKPTYWKANMYNQIIENKIIDGGVRGIMQFINYSSRKLRLLQSGYVTNYLIISILTIYLFIIIWFNENTIILFLNKIFK